jgi:tetratricopeptide (TPR) repeat protein
VREARDHMAGLLDTARHATPVNEGVVGEIGLNCGEMSLALDDADAAESYIKPTLAFIAAHPDSEARMQPEAKSVLGFAYLLKGALNDAQAMFEASVKVAAEKKVPDTELSDARLAFVHALRGDIDGALTMARAARDGVVKGEGENSFDAADIHYFYARILEMAERPREAEAEYRASIASQMAMLPPDGMHLYSADARFALGTLLARSPQTRDEGQRFLAQAATLREAALGVDHPRAIEARHALAQATASH